MFDQRTLPAHVAHTHTHKLCKYYCTVDVWNRYKQFKSVCRQLARGSHAVHRQPCRLQLTLQYPAKTTMDADYADDLHFSQIYTCSSQILMHSLKQAARDIDPYVNTDKTEFMHFNQDGAISSLNGKLLKFVDQFTYLGSNISSTESDVSLGKTWLALNNLLIIWKSNLSDKINWEFLQAVAVSTPVEL